MRSNYKVNRKDAHGWTHENKVESVGKIMGLVNDHD